MVPSGCPANSILVINRWGGVGGVGRWPIKGNLTLDLYSNTFGLRAPKLGAKPRFPTDFNQFEIQRGLIRDQELNRRGRFLIHRFLGLPHRWGEGHGCTMGAGRENRTKAKEREGERETERDREKGESIYCIIQTLVKGCTKNHINE